LGSHSVVAALCILFFSAIVAFGQPVAAGCELRVEVRGAARQPIAGAKVDISGPGRAVSDRTGAGGNARVTLPRPGVYRVSASADGYNGLSREVEVAIGDTLIVEFQLLPRLGEAQSVTVTASADPVAGSGDSASGRDVRSVPERPAALREALPLI